MKLYKCKVIIGFKKVFFKEVEHTTTVRKIGNGWNCRVLTNGEVNQEIRVFRKEDIRIAIGEMLRWEDKCGNISQMASASRERNYRGKHA